MVFHPPGLESRVLAVVAEDQQSPSVRVVNHVLCQNVHVRHVGGPDGTRRLPVVAAKMPADSSAGKTTGEIARIIFALLNNVQLDGFSSSTAVSAINNRTWMRRTAAAAEKEFFHTVVFVQVFVVAVSNQVVYQYDPVAALGFCERFPVV